MPKPRKALIYLDQNAISEMMKALNPRTDAHRAGRVRPLWDELFGKLDRLCKLHLVACPESDAHLEESRLSEHYNALKQMYEHLSCGVSFHDAETVRRFQIEEHFAWWLKPEGPFSSTLTRPDVAQGSIDIWMNRFRFSFSIPWRPEDVAADRELRARTHAAGMEIIERWRAERHRSFKEWYREELRGLGFALHESFLYRVGALLQASKGGTLLDGFEILTPAFILGRMLLDRAEKHGCDPNEALRKLKEYFESADLGEVAFMRIAAALYAKMAEQMAHGRKKPPTEGFVTDVSVVATVLPYCDALFVDNEIAAFLNDHEVRTVIGIPTRVFCARSHAAFLAYLDDLERNADPAFLAAVLEVYGPDWPEPYRSMYGEPSR